MTLGSVMVKPPLPSFYYYNLIQATSKSLTHFDIYEFLLGFMITFAFVVLIWSACDLIDACYESQSGGSLSRYDQRKINAEKARAKNERGLAAKEKRNSTSKKTIRFKNETVVNNKNKNYKKETVLESQAKTLGLNPFQIPLPAKLTILRKMTLILASLGTFLILLTMLHQISTI